MGVVIILLVVVVVVVVLLVRVGGDGDDDEGTEPPDERCAADVEGEDGDGDGGDISLSDELWELVGESSSCVGNNPFLFLSIIQEEKREREEKRI